MIASNQAVGVSRLAPFQNVARVCTGSSGSPSEDLTKIEAIG